MNERMNDYIKLTTMQSTVQCRLLKLPEYFNGFYRWTQSFDIHMSRE